jgi:hypothetical protein
VAANVYAASAALGGGGGRIDNRSEEPRSDREGGRGEASRRARARKGEEGCRRKGRAWLRRSLSLALASHPSLER